MPKVQAFAISGLDVRFYSSDHLPPHIHVRDVGEWEIRVYFLLCTERRLEYDVKWPKSFDGPRSKTGKRILEKVLANKAALLAEWEANVDY